MEFNINDYVKVKLTEFGKGRLLVDHANFWADVNVRTGGKTPFPTYVAPKEDENGYSRWQLWSLMEQLGKYCNIGGKPPFETTIIIEITA